ncbi:jg20041 [Pararge aegeria aegeria]|uniref:Jg20041 protein n=1 Tax=Pararge aegeria aegeria TaxID=348720 RepID=A0A8S4R5P7_9NEOP|nr:jg20041 [Pararge aegeria aegeria]
MAVDGTSQDQQCRKNSTTCNIFTKVELRLALTFTLAPQQHSMKHSTTWAACKANGVSSAGWSDPAGSRITDGSDQLSTEIGQEQQKKKSTVGIYLVFIYRHIFWLILMIKMKPPILFIPYLPQQAIQLSLIKTGCASSITTH